MSKQSTQNMSVDELRAQISQRLRSKAAFSRTVYQEQPIIKTAAQLKTFTPEPIREARQLARTARDQNKGVATVFYEQARLLAGYEDDYEYEGTFSQYYPTYEDMSNEQLRGYFSWRTQVRRGNIKQTSLSFAYVYLFELINLVGVESAEEGYRAMRSFGEAYRRYDKRFAKYCEEWLDDLVIYYGLDANLLTTCRFHENDCAFDVLLNYQGHTRDELFDALCQLSSYPIMDSPFCFEHEAELKHLVVHAYLTAARHHDEKLSTPLAAKLSGRLEKKRMSLFSHAVFADPLDIQSITYQLSPHDTFFCRNGAWFRVRYASLETPLPWVSQLLETSECMLRDAYAYPNTLTPSLKTKYIMKALTACAEQLVAQQREREARAVHIDFGKLDHIRNAADETCEKLIVEEEQGAPVFTVSMNEALEPRSKGASHKDGEAARQGATIEVEAPRSCDPAIKALSTDEALLSPIEAKLLAHLLQGGSAHEFERAHTCIASVLVDSINDKLYDEFADICIDASAAEPAIIEDYADDLRALLEVN